MRIWLSEYMYTTAKTGQSLSSFFVQVSCKSFSNVFFLLNTDLIVCQKLWDDFIVMWTTYLKTKNLQCNDTITNVTFQVVGLMYHNITNSKLNELTCQIGNNQALLPPSQVKINVIETFTYNLTLVLSKILIFIFSWVYRGWWSSVRGPCYM